MNSNEEFDLMQQSPRTWYPTQAGNISLRSWATLLAIETAANLRGCVTTILHCRRNRLYSSKMNWGTCVVLPHPVPPFINTTRFASMAFKIVFLWANTGNVWFEWWRTNGGTACWWNWIVGFIFGGWKSFRSICALTKPQNALICSFDSSSSSKLQNKEKY